MAEDYRFLGTVPKYLNNHRFLATLGAEGSSITTLSAPLREGILRVIADIDVTLPQLSGALEANMGAVSSRYTLLAESNFTLRATGQDMIVATGMAGVSSMGVAKGTLLEVIDAGSIWLVISNGLSAAGAGNAYSQTIVPLGDSRSYQNWAYSTDVPSALARGPLFWAEALSARVRMDYRFGLGVSGNEVDDIRYRIENNVKNAYGFGPADIPAGCPVVLLAGTNNATGATSKAYMDAVLADHFWITSWLLRRGHKVIVVAEWPRTGLTTDQQKLFLYYVDQLRKNYAGVKNVWLVDVWRLVTDPVATTITPRGTILDADGLHNSPGIAYITGREIARCLDEMGFPRLHYRPGSNADLYDAVLNPRGCINTNPLLQGSAGTAGSNVTGTIPDGYTINVSAGLSAVCSRQTIQLDGVDRDVLRIVVSGTPTSGNGYVQIRDPGLQTSVAPGDVLEAGYECIVRDGHVNFAAPGLMIDTGVTASRVHAGLSQTGDSMMPSYVVEEFAANPRTYNYIVPNPVPASLALDLRPYFTASGVASSLTIDMISCYMRKVSEGPKAGSGLIVNEFGLVVPD